ncbi:MAG: hypothetical protein OEV04_09220, partial [Nitrospira sp.]|nr:hypothetical protein [Nitrospira sp.]
SMHPFMMVLPLNSQLMRWKPPPRDSHGYLLRQQTTRQGGRILFPSSHQSKQAVSGGPNKILT